MNRLKTRYQQEVVPALKKEFGYTNVTTIFSIFGIAITLR